MMDSASSIESDGETSRHGLRDRRVSLAALIAVLILVGLASQIVSLPLNRIIELRYCQEHYAVADPSVVGPGGFVPEHLCKIDEVQKKLGWMQGVYQTIASAIDIVITLPMGYVADRLGARVALTMNILATGVVLLWLLIFGYFQNSFPVTAILAGPLLAFWGGGLSVFKSATLTILTEIATSERHRSTYLAYMTSVNYITQFFSPALAGMLMEKNLWLPLWLGLVSTAIAAPTLSFLPLAKAQNRAAFFSFKQNVDTLEEEPLLDATRDQSYEGAATAYPQCNPVHDLVHRYTKLVASSSTFRLLLTIVFLTGFASSTSPLLIRYISKRYDWTYSNIGYLFTFKAAVNVFLLAVAVPAFTRLLLAQPNSTAAEVNLTGARAALFASVVGAALIATSVNISMLILAICVYAIGSALPVFTFALARSNSIGTTAAFNESSTFSLVILVNSLGGVVGTPVMTYLWVKGIQLGGAALGLPYFASANVYAAVSVVAGVVKLT